LLRYSRQLSLKVIGIEGQRKLREASIAIVGCGALGSHSAELLTRMGVGRLKLIDRDVVELENLHRQYYTEEHARNSHPKAIALAERLSKVNSEVEIGPVIADVNSRNVVSLITDVDIVVDGTDNFETRFLLNDACIKLGKPCVFGAAVETYGMVYPVLPSGPCLRDLMDSPPPPGSVPTCDVVGILPTVASMVSSQQITEVLKILLGKAETGKVLFFNPWERIFDEIKVAKRDDCPSCALSKFEYLSKEVKDAELCGRSSVHLSSRGPVDIRSLYQRLTSLQDLQDELRLKLSAYALYIKGRDFEMILFPDGRAIVKGADLNRAKSLYARYVGI